MTAPNTDVELHKNLHEFQRLHQWLTDHASPICIDCPCPYHTAIPKPVKDSA